MCDSRWAGTEMRRRQGAESNHVAMAEHPNQGDPIAKTMAQKAAAKAEGNVAPVPSSAKLLQHGLPRAAQQALKEGRTSAPMGGRSWERPIRKRKN